MKTNNYLMFCSIGQIIDTAANCIATQKSGAGGSPTNNPFHLTSNETNKDNAESVGKGTENPMRYLQAAPSHPVSQLKIDCNLLDRTWLLAASSKFTAFQLLSCIIPLDRGLWGAR